MQKQKKFIMSGIEMVEVRSALTCGAIRGICAKCYGMSLSTNRMAQVGESVGVVAAQSVGEPGTQLTLRTFHVGGTASRSEVESNITVKRDGVLEIDDLKTVEGEDTNGNKNTIVISRSAEARIIDKESNSVLSTHIIPYGSSIFITKGNIKKEIRFVNGIRIMRLLYLKLLVKLNLMILLKEFLIELNQTNKLDIKKK